MTPFIRPLAGLVLVAATSPTVRAADATDPARLFPAGALAYVEVADPATVAPQLAAVFKGTPLEDSLKFIEDRRAAAKTPQDLFGKPELAVLGLLASPEFAAELKHLRVGVALTGFTERGEPQAAVAVLTGDCPAAGLAARAFLALATVRKVAAVGDVPVYQFRQPSFSYDPNTGRQKLDTDKPPAEGTYEATFAYLPGLFVVGTSRAAVGEVVTRFRGEGKGALADVAAFKEAAAAHRTPSLFYFVNVAEYCAKIDEARQKSSEHTEPDAIGWSRLVVNAKAVRHLAGSVRFRDGGLAATAGVSFDPTQKSPLLEFLSGPGVKVELLHHAPAPAAFAVAVTLPEKDRAAAVIGFLDAVAKAGGELGRLPGEAVKELEARYKDSVADGLIGKVRAVTVVMPVKQDLPNGAVPRPMFIFHTDGAEVAERWERFIPRLVGDLSGTNPPPQPSSETVNGVKVLSLPGTGLPWKGAVHYARKEAVFVVGLDRKLVAAAVTADPTRAAPGSAAAPGEAPVLLGSLSLGGLLDGPMESPQAEGPVVPITPVAPAVGRRRPVGGQPPGEEQREEEKKAWAALVKAMNELPPATLTARRTGNELRLEVWQPKVQGGGLAGVITAGTAWFDATLDRNVNPNQYPNPGFGRFR